MVSKENLVDSHFGRGPWTTRLYKDRSEESLIILLFFFNRTDFLLPLLLQNPKTFSMNHDSACDIK